MYQVINIDKTLNFSGRGKALSVNAALDLYDSLGGNIKGFRVQPLFPLSK
jgi:hypothetical protein